MQPHVLLVDDDDVLLERMKTLVQSAGFRVSTAADGVEALQTARLELPDIIVTDVHMPRMGGPRLIPALRAIPELADRPILVVTADETRSTKISLLQAGADDFVVKPVDPEEFQARLVALARKAQLAGGLMEAERQRDEALKRLELRTRELEKLTLGLVTALEKANTYNDSDTGNHIRRVCDFAALLARAYGCDEGYVENIRAYAGLHDVGKVGISDAVLKKPGKLTPEEFENMKTHTLIGAELLRATGISEMARNIALYHHERWNGKGYPHGLSGSNIPLEARIVAVVDVYDALRTKRCYKPAFSFEKSCEIIRESAGVHMDPGLAELFLTLKEQIFEIESYFQDHVVGEGWE
jgi:putative two-component system response regulator